MATLSRRLGGRLEGSTGSSIDLVLRDRMWPIMEFPLLRLSEWLENDGEVCEGGGIGP